MDSGPSFALVFGCLCIAPLIAVICVILLVWLSRRSGANVPADAIATCPTCGREFLRTAAACPHCGAPAKGAP
jgi:predicted amidophosphoribosyltransferase